MIANDYDMPMNSITTRNQHANAFVNLVHLTLDNILRTFNIEEMNLDNENSWEGILLFTMLALRSKVHTTAQYTP